MSETVFRHGKKRFYDTKNFPAVLPSLVISL